jgi:hypothetical protein
MKRPIESDYTSLVAYTRALEKYCDALAQPEQEPVCDKDPQGCWSVRCQLGKKCKNATPPAAQQEPVAWVEYETGNRTKRPQNCGTGYCSCIECVMEPPQRVWVDLTDEEAQWLYDNCRTPSNLIDMTEAKLKEKNT